MSRPCGIFGQSDLLTDQEISRILSIPKLNTVSGRRDYVVLLILSNTPMRVSELCELKFSNIQHRSDGFYISYISQKSNSQIDIKIKEDVYSLVMRYSLGVHKGNCSNNNKLFLAGLYSKKRCPHCNQKISQKGDMERKRVNDLLSKYIKKAGISKRVTPHSFRHTYLTRLSKNGCSPKEIGKIAGHTDIGSTVDYLRQETDIQKIILDKCSFS